ncbi:MAG: hypothetical protein ACMUIE_09110 [Thermoplasmatota archaeon]
MSRSRTSIQLAFLAVLLIASVTAIAEQIPTRDIGSPELLKAIPGNGLVILEWQPPQIGGATVTGYNIYRAEKPGEEELIFTTDRDITNFRDTQVINLITYTYFVTALSGPIESDPSSSVTALPEGEPPYVRIDKPSDNTSTNEDMIVVAWYGLDVISGIEKYFIHLNDDTWIDKMLETTHTFTEIEQGHHRIEVRAVDKASNWNTTSIDITIDSDAPDLRISSPAEGAFLTDPELTVSWEGEDQVSGISKYMVKINSGGWVDNGLEEQYVTALPKGGPGVAEVMVFDNAGNTASRVVNFTIDLQDPFVMIDSPADGIYLNSSSALVKWRGSDPEGDLKKFSIRWDRGGWLELGDRKDFNLMDLDEGVHEVHVRAEDQAGRTFEASSTFTVDLSDPVLELQEPINGTYTNKNRIDISWKADDLVSGILKFIYSVDGNRSSRLESDIERITVGMSSGHHRITITAYDLAYNERTVDVYITVDNSPPLAIDWFPLGAGQDDDAVIGIIFNEDMDPGGISMEVENASGSVRQEGNGFIFETDERMEPGRTYIVSAIGTDLAGNPSVMKLWQFTVRDTVNLIGKVYGEGGVPLKGAVIVLGTGKSTTTDGEGSYNIQARLSETIIIASMEGYRDQKIELNLTSLDDRKIPNIYLEKVGGGGSFKVPSFLMDPFTYIVLVLVLVILVLAGYLMKDKIEDVMEKLRSRRKNG